MAKPYPGKNNPTDPDRLKHFEFQEFVQWFPHAALKKARIRRSSFVAVSMTLTRYGDFKTGTHIWPSVRELASASGVSEPTVRRVLDYLQSIGVLVVTGQHRHAGGSPITEYRFVRHQVVAETIARKDRDYTRVNPGTAQGSNLEPLRVNPGTAEGQSWNHDRNDKKDKQERSVAVAHSPAPASLSPAASDGAQGKYDDLLIFEGVPEELLANL